MTKSQPPFVPIISFFDNKKEHVKFFEPLNGSFVLTCSIFIIRNSESAIVRLFYASTKWPK